MTVRRYPVVIVAIFAAVLIGATDVGADVDSLYRAGKMNGHYMYWLPESGLPLDTLDFGIATNDFEPGGTSAIKSIHDAAAFFRPSGKTLCRVKSPCAMAVLAMLDQGMNLLALTQWRTTPTQLVFVPKPDMIQQTNRPTILSDFLWAPVVRAVSENMAEVSGDYQVQLIFGGSGYSYYDGREIVVGASKQIRGAEGLSINVKESDYKEDMNVQRTIFGLFVVVPKGVVLSDVVKGIEKAMDRRKLDLSYQVPEIVPIK